MAVYLLSALLISILAFAIVQLSKKSEVEAEIEKLKQRHELSLLTELHAAEKVVWLCFVGGLLLTANYAITYFSGSELVNIPHWGFLQWSGAFIGLVIAVSITFVQKVLYSSPTHSKAGLIVTTLVLTFVIISEIGAPIEKEGMKMKEASQNSAVFKAVVGQIQGSTDATAHYSKQIATAKAEKAQHEFERQRCERHQSKGEQRVQR
jgi:predicted secreted protein